MYLARVISQPEGRLTEPQRRRSVEKKRVRGCSFRKEREVKCYMQQLLSGLQHCHERGILHRDIKGSNLLIDKNGVLKIADFGLANFFQPKPKKPLTSRVVTLWYRAPELLLGSTDYGVGIDLWSTGCLLAEMFIGRPIMPGRTEVEQLHKIFKLCGSPSEDYWRRRKLSTTFRPPQEYKPNFQEAFANLPMSSFSLLTTLLALEPAYRGTATSALQNEFFSSSPLACDLSGLPSIYEEDEPIMTNDPKKMRAHRKTQQPQKYSGGHKKKVSITEPAKEDSGSFIEERYSQELSSSFSSISLHRKSTGTDQESPPSSPTQAFRAYGNQYTRTQAHPNAMKNIKNFPILYASMGNPISFEDNRLTSSSFEDNRLTLNQRSISTVDLRTADLEKISKLFGLEDN
ncbi:unnamed protein product [Thlaspi arvense]|uniref:Protein kinase domain-containing protein n=1 Tax=Thlaspi arvense TaxID=13288 RepID=A0AAU9T8L8_THLAR|nr:unnamed protein product [Thlaspi arvense]